MSIHLDHFHSFSTCCSKFKKFNSTSLLPQQKALFKITSFRTYIFNLQFSIQPYQPTLPTFTSFADQIPSDLLFIDDSIHSSTRFWFQKHSNPTSPQITFPAIPSIQAQQPQPQSKSSLRPKIKHWAIGLQKPSRVTSDHTAPSLSKSSNTSTQSPTGFLF